MNIKLKLVGIQKMERMIGGNEILLQVEGSTFGDLVNHLQKTYGEPIMECLHCQILRNGKEWIKTDNFTYPLQDGDHVTFLQMMGGG
jgi:molybdopterin converting factor small subunit